MSGVEAAVERPKASPHDPSVYGTLQQSGEAVGGIPSARKRLAEAGLTEPLLVLRRFDCRERHPLSSITLRSAPEVAAEYVALLPTRRVSKAKPHITDLNRPRSMRSKVISGGGDQVPKASCMLMGRGRASPCHCAGSILGRSGLWTATKKEGGSCEWQPGR